MTEWKFCPECGSNEIHYEEGQHKQCKECHQEWFSDVDYSDVVAKNLGTLRAALAAKDEEIARLMDLIRWAHDTLYEINPSNYDHDEVCKINDASVEVILGLAPALGERHGKSAEWWAERAKEKPEWHPISTCPVRDNVDLWCVYGGEEFAQFEGGSSIGFLVSNRFKTEEYGFFGNQSKDGVPRRDGPDFVPVAWRHAVPSCPPSLIAEALGIPLTLEDALAGEKADV